MHKDTLELLKSHKLFSNLPPKQLAYLFEKATFKKFKKGYTLFIQDEPATFMYLIVCGWVKLYRETINGDEYIADILTEGHILGENAIFHNDTYPYGAEIIEDAALVSIPLALLKEYIDTTPSFAGNMLSFLARQQLQQEKNREHLVIQNAPQKIGCFLLQLAPKSPTEPVVLHLPYDKSLLASRLGIQRETLSRALALLQKEKLVEVYGASVTIPNVQNLVQYCCGACTNGYPCGD